MVFGSCLYCFSRYFFFLFTYCTFVVTLLFRLLVFKIVLYLFLYNLILHILYNIPSQVVGFQDAASRSIHVTQSTTQGQRDEIYRDTKGEASFLFLNSFILSLFFPFHLASFIPFFISIFIRFCLQKPLSVYPSFRRFFTFVDDANPKIGKVFWLFFC